MWPCLLAVVLLVPTALAAPSMSASALDVTGDTEVRGDAAALFALARDGPFSWSVTAAGGELVREFSTYTAVDHPLNEQYLHDQWTDYQTETVELGATQIVSQGSLPDGALLLLSHNAILDARTDGLVTIHSETDPVIRQTPESPADLQTAGGDDGYLRWTLAGDYLNLTFAEGATTIRGDITLLLYGPAYALDHAGESTTMRTGKFESENNGVLARGADERHTLTLHDAILQLAAPGGARIYTQFPELDLSGSVRAEDADGSIELDGAELAPAPDGALAWTGATTLALAPAAGRILATTPEPLVAAGGAVVSQGPTLLVLSLAGGLALVLALALVLLAVRRRRAGDLDAALLAMEERRWDDALPHLTVIAKRDPANAGVQIDRALCLEQTGRFDDAAKAFEAALRSAPQHAEAHFYYARTLAKMREGEAARAHLEAALERDPRLAEMARTETVLRGL
jgi:hypothetical protein